MRDLYTGMSQTAHIRSTKVRVSHSKSALGRPLPPSLLPHRKRLSTAEGHSCIRLSISGIGLVYNTEGGGLDRCRSDMSFIHRSIVLSVSWLPPKGTFRMVTSFVVVCLPMARSWRSSTDGSLCCLYGQKGRRRRKRRRSNRLIL